MDSNVLLLGGSGTLGSKIIKSKVFNNLKYPLKKKLNILNQKKIFNYLNYHKIDIVLHLASLIAIPHSYHSPYSYLNTNAGFSNAGGSNYTNAWTSTKFSIGGDGASNTNTDNYIAYCWHSVPGYSKMGVYRTNGNANGPYEHLGFKPAWIMIKNYSGTKPWYIIDNKRSPHNERKKSLKPNTNDAEATDSNFIDFYSMGFKLRTSGSYVNGGNSTDRIIYMAFAEQSGRNEFGTFANAG